MCSAPRPGAPSAAAVAGKRWAAGRQNWKKKRNKKKVIIHPSVLLSIYLSIETQPQILNLGRVADKRNQAMMTD